MSTKYTWYVQPIGDFTNKRVSQGLSEEEDFLHELDTKQGLILGVWRVPYQSVRALWASDRGKLRFVVFRQVGHGTPEKWPPAKEKRSRTASGAAVMTGRQLAEQQRNS